MSGWGRPRREGPTSITSRTETVSWSAATWPAVGGWYPKWLAQYFESWRAELRHWLPAAVKAEHCGWYPPPASGVRSSPSGASPFLRKGRPVRSLTPTWYPTGLGQGEPDLGVRLLEK